MNTDSRQGLWERGRNRSCRQVRWMLGLLLMVLAPRSLYAQPEVPLEARLEAVLSPDDGEDHEEFGFSVAMGQDRALVGAIGADEGRGAVYVFERSGDAWEQTGRLTGSNTGVNASFGWAVVLDGDRAFISAPRQDDRGAVYVFERNADGTWDEHQELTPEDQDDGDTFGFSLAASGDRVLIGNPVYQGDEGAVWLFERQSDGRWEETELWEGNGGSAFGTSVAIEGDQAFISAPSEDLDRGEVLLFERDGDRWERVSPTGTGERGFTGSDAVKEDYFGEFMAMDGDRLLVSAVNHEVDGAEAAGAVYAFERRSASWQEVDRLVAPDPEDDLLFGFSVALDGDLAAVGATGYDDGNGAVYLFAWTGEEWEGADLLTLPVPAKKPGPAGGAAKRQAAPALVAPNFGFSVSVFVGTTTYVLAGAPGLQDGPQAPAKQADTGFAYLFEIVSGANQAPVAAADAATTAEDTAVEIDVLANDTDPEGDELSLSIAEAPGHGTATVGENGTITYTPEENFTGEDTFTYGVDDGSGEPSEASVTVTVTAVNDAPSAAAITSPADGARLVVGGADGVGEPPASPSETMAIAWEEALDPEGDAPTYTWQLSSDPAFNELLADEDVGEETGLMLTLGTLAALLDQAGVALGEEVELFHRVVVSDGAAETKGEVSRVTLIRGTLVATEGEGDVPRAFALHSAYPNPFNPQATVPFDVAEPSEVSLRVYDALGREVATLVQGTLSPGRREVTWQAAGMPSGIYLVRMEASGSTFTHKIVLLK